MNEMYSFLSESILIQEDSAARDAKRDVDNALKKFKGNAPARNPGESNPEYAKRLKDEYAKTKKGNPSGSKPNPLGSKHKNAVPVGKVEPVKKVSGAGSAAREAKRKSTALVPSGKRNEHKVANAGKKALSHLSKHKGKYATGAVATGLAGYGIYKWAKNKKAAAKKDK